MTSATVSSTPVISVPATPEAAGAAEGTDLARRARLRSDVRQAARVLATTWPISTFIAVNPLAGLESVPFAEAVRTAERSLGAQGTLDEARFRAAYRSGRVSRSALAAALRRRGLAGEAPAGPGGGPGADPLGTTDLLSDTNLLLADLLGGEPAPRPQRADRMRSEEVAPDVAATVDALTARWVTAYLDDGHSGWAMPGRERGLYPAWRELAALDRSLPAPVRRRLADLPAVADDAVLAALDCLGVGSGAHVAYLRAHLTRLPGWSSHIRWRADRGEGIDLVGYLALRLAYEAALLGSAPAGVRPPADRAERPGSADGDRALRAHRALGVPDPDPRQLDRARALLARLPERERTLVWLDAYESHYRDRLLDDLAAHRPATLPERPAAQVVCCIDVRSEGLRRHLEAAGPYETFGFAGFFAVAIRYRGLSDGDTSDQCPALLRPRNDVAERPVPGAGAVADRSLAGRLTMAAAVRGAGTAKREPMAPFALAEAAGWLTGPLAAARTLAVGAVAAAREHLGHLVAPPVPTVVDVDAGFSAEERVLAAEVALRTMGLTGGRTRALARLVVLCGHGSTTENNPFASALDCGACGGSPGGANARTAAAVLNRADVRAALRGRGVDVPADTWFVAAEHDTVTDRVRLLDRHLVPEGHLPDLDRLDADLRHAGNLLAAERCATLPGAPHQPSPRRAARHVRRRAADWAQVYPEWGLAGNAAFVVGPRSMTAGLDLGRRVFLHSYDAAVDPDGSALETILTAPLVVAQWINCQYYFSSVAPDVFGAGTKTVHNVVGEAGVLSGPGGDLRQGLPWQSVAVGDRLVHEPMRLLAVVQAEPSRIGEIVDRNRVLQDLLGNAWLALAARERPEEDWQRWTPLGFRPWVEPEEEHR